MRIIWKGKFDGNEESLPHGEHKPKETLIKSSHYAANMV